MAFFEQRFPEGISEGAMGGPVWSTGVGMVQSGRRVTNRNWSMPLHRYDVSHALKKGSSRETLKAFFYVTAGRADGFRYKDWNDYEVTQSTGSLSLISGSDYQMNRVYTAFARTFTRTIQKPVTGTVTVYRTRAAVTSVISPTINYTTGIVTVSGHVGGDTYSWAGQFDVPVAFANDEAMFRVIATGEMKSAWPQIALEEIRL